MSNDADLLPITEVARAAGVSVNTVRDWEKKGWVSARGKGRGRLFHLLEVQGVCAPAGHLHLGVAAERLGVPVRLLSAWEAARRIPAFMRTGGRRVFVAESDIPRIRAWFVWDGAAKLAADYPPMWDPFPAQKDIWEFERAIAAGSIPERFSAAHYDPRGWRYDPIHAQRRGAE